MNNVRFEVISWGSLGELTLLFHRNRRGMSYSGRSNGDENRVRMLRESASEETRCWWIWCRLVVAPNLCSKAVDNDD